MPFSFSARGKASGGVVFAGYGITAPEYNYDDYAGIDVKGKFVLVLAHEPQEYDEKSIFDGKVYTDHSQYYSKAANARRHGAAGVILINDRINHKTSADELEAFGSAAGPTDAGILFVQVKEQVVEPWFRAEGKDLMDLERGIDADVKPRSFRAQRASKCARTSTWSAWSKRSTTFWGICPGKPDEYLIIGAHYDHLGLGGTFSLAPSLTGTVHPGADDNASGTAGVIELARHFSALPKPKRGILFMTFAGEELGLLGSGFYANHPELPLDKAVTMINMDMIGRVRDGKLFIGGAGTGTTLRKDLDALTPRFRACTSIIPIPAGTVRATIPHSPPSRCLCFSFSPDCTATITNRATHGTRSMLRARSRCCSWWRTSRTGSIRRPTGRSSCASRRKKTIRTPVSSAGSGGGYGPYFGSIPDFAEPPRGVRFADITPESPAAQGWFEGGRHPGQSSATDPVQNLYDFTYALRSHKAGDAVEVEVLRG